MAFFPFQMVNPMPPPDRSYQQFQENMMRAMAMGDAYQMPAGSHAEAQAGYYRPWRHVPSQRGGSSQVVMEKDSFKIELDVQHFSPEEISVKTADHHIIVEGKHDEKQDEHGFVSRNFTRRYFIPDGAQVELITANLSSDGLLTVSAPMHKSGEEANERVIPIKATGVPADRKATANTSHTPMEEK